MKRALSFLLALGLFLSVFAFAETDDPSVPAQPQPEEAEETGDTLPDEDEGDDSNPLPVDIMEDEDLDAEEELADCASCRDKQYQIQQEESGRSDQNGEDQRIPCQSGLGNQVALA